MDVELTPEQDEFIRRVVAQGRISRPEDVLHEAIDALMNREYIRDEIQSLLDVLDMAPDDEAPDLDALRVHLLSALTFVDGQARDDPFATFDEWWGENDRKAYAGL